MSMELHVACPVGAPLPSADALHTGAKQGGVHLLIPALDWSDQSGFLPMVIEGHESGVEVDVFQGDDAQEIIAAFKHIGPSRSSQRAGGRT